MRVFATLLCILLLSYTQQSIADGQGDAADNQLISSLAEELRNRKTVAQAIDTIAASNAPRRGEWLELILDGRLYVRKSDGLVVGVTKTDSGFALTNAADGSTAGSAGKREVVKVKINNALRSKLRAALAQLALSDPDPEQRLAAVEQMLESLDDDKAQTISALVASESDAEVRAMMELAGSINLLQNGDTSQQLAAITELGVNTRPLVSQRLTELTQSADPEVAAAAEASLEKIRARISIFEKIETLLFGLSLGSVLAMAAIGLAITFGVMGVINMAHGEMIMLGAYCTWFLQTMLPGFIEYSLVVAIPLAFAVTFIVGMIIEYLVIRHLYGRPLETLLATFGISLLLQQTVRTLVSPQNVPVSNPSWLTGQVHIDPALSIALNRLVIFVFCLVVFALLMWLLKKTFFGLKVRAVSQNREMARAMGAQSSRIDAMTFGLGAGIAGVAGVALSQLTNVGPNMGQAYIVDSFMVVVFGGVGNLWGTLLAGLSLGVANKFLEPWVGAVVAKIVVLVFIIVFIQRYPRGLFPQRGRAAGN
ncbi:MAG: urea ABC transporter permease subunit UrtB [Pseudomonadota bacterium]